MNKKIICGITGHTGSIGTHLTKNTKNFEFIYFKEDITKNSLVNSWIKNNKLEIIVHLAAIVPIKVVNDNPKKAYKVNVSGTKNLVNAILKYDNDIKWVFFSSTSHVYSTATNKIKENSAIKPISYYGKTKHLAEKEIERLKQKNIKFCIGRIFSTTNSNQRKNYLVPDLKKKIKTLKEPVILENLNHFRDFISINDICKIIKKLSKKRFNGIINIASGKKTKLSEIAKTISIKFKRKILIKENKNPSTLIANNNLLKKIYKFKIKTKIKDLIF
jgi:nucleoside-diphosphate-sugar epimerase